MRGLPSVPVALDLRSHQRGENEQRHAHGLEAGTLRDGCREHLPERKCLRKQGAAHSSPRKAVVLTWVVMEGLSPGLVKMRLCFEDKSSGRLLGTKTVEVKAGRDHGPQKR